ncbi:MAG: ribosome maturation factor RimP [Gemmatimonadota bacterium]
MEKELEEFLAGLGFELVQMERGGGRRRPLLRLRIDHLESEAQESAVVTLEDCARVSRAVDEFLVQRDGTAEFTLEVSSPGVERPLVKERDFERFAGSMVRLRGYEPLHAGAKQVEGELVGLVSGETEPRALVQVDDEKLEIPLSGLARATLLYRLADDL